MFAIRSALTALLFWSMCSVGWTAENWPQFRGRGGLGVGQGNPPTEWNVETAKNIAWKTSIPGLGHSSPIVWGDRVFLTTAVNADTENPEVKTGWSGGAGESAEDSGDWSWRVLCLQLGSGKILWSKDALVGQPAFKRHLKATHANCTPATDGKHVVAFFGSQGLYCYDFEGQLLWSRDLGKLHSGPYDAPKLEWGFASSPIIHEGHVIVQCDCLNANFVSILDIATGKEIRRIDRKGEVATWSTPLVVGAKNHRQIVCNGYRQMAGYDFETGQKLWSIEGGGDVPVPTPLFAEGLIYITNGHARSHTYAVKPSAVGELNPTDEKENPGLAWMQDRDGSYMPTPLVKAGLLYTCNDNGRLTVRNALSGDLVYRKRVGRGSGTFSASAVAAGGHLYFVNELGEVAVIKEGEEHQVVARNKMDEIVMATPAIAGDRLLIRTVDHLVCIQRVK